MTIISQNGMIELPHECTTVDIDRENKTKIVAIFTYFNRSSPFYMAEYSTESKAKQAIEMFKKADKHGFLFQFPRDVELNGLKASDQKENGKTEFDDVNKPHHYAGTKIEVIDYIEDKQLGFCLGNVVKYVSRAGRKHSSGISDREEEIQDLEKARWHLERRIKELKENMDV